MQRSDYYRELKGNGEGDAEKKYRTIPGQIMESGGSIRTRVDDVEEREQHRTRSASSTTPRLGNIIGHITWVLTSSGNSNLRVQFRSPLFVATMTIHIKNLKARPRKGVQSTRLIYHIYVSNSMKQPRKPWCVPHSSPPCCLAGQLRVMLCRLTHAKRLRTTYFSACVQRCVNTFVYGCS